VGKALIQARLPFPEHLRTSPGVLDADMAPLHSGIGWKLAASGQSPAIGLSVSSLLRHAQQARSLQLRYAIRRDHPAALAMPSLPMTLVLEKKVILCVLHALLL